METIKLEGLRYYYFIEGKVRKQLKEYANYGLENGGYLLGRRILDTNEIIITKFTKPIPEDKRTKNSFKISDKHHLEAEKYAYEEGWMIVGFWHSHPPHLESSKASDKDWKAFKHSMILRSYFVEYIVHKNDDTAYVIERPTEEIIEEHQWEVKKWKQ